MNRAFCRIIAERMPAFMSLAGANGLNFGTILLGLRLGKRIFLTEAKKHRSIPEKRIYPFKGI
ncbi:MAG: hypothetical protein D6714_13545 [Bacteroidetes bacterium]|nr:MAG: hypothetical protein D6714_13545 [Bacteroidota bacterium]